MSKLRWLAVSGIAKPLLAGAVFIPAYHIFMGTLGEMLGGLTTATDVALWLALAWTTGVGVLVLYRIALWERSLLDSGFEADDDGDSGDDPAT